VSKAHHQCKARGKSLPNNQIDKANDKYQSSFQFIDSSKINFTQHFTDMYHHKTIQKQLTSKIHDLWYRVVAHSRAVT